MEFLKFLTFFVSVSFVFTACNLTEAYKFFPGGRDGWVLHPSEDYSQWAGRNRFLINDTIYFKYKKGEDSVLLVTAEDYSSCNTKNPIKKWDDGDTLFQFDQSGPFYFISGRDGNCQQGQKLTVVVLAVRRPPSVPSPTSAPPPEVEPPVVSPASSVPSPSTSSSPPSSTPSSTSPSGSETAASPVVTSPPPSNSPASIGGFPSLWASVSAGVVVLFVVVHG